MSCPHIVGAQVGVLRCQPGARRLHPGRRGSACDIPARRDPLPAAMQSGEESDAEFMEELDAAGKAEVLALAKRMLRRKSRDELLEGAYNKYAFNDAGALPRWFAEDQQRYARRDPFVFQPAALECHAHDAAALVRECQWRTSKSISDVSAVDGVLARFRCLFLSVDDIVNRRPTSGCGLVRCVVNI